MQELNQLNNNINILVKEQQVWIDKNNMSLGTALAPSLIQLLEEAIKPSRSNGSSSGSASSMSVINDRAFILREEILANTNEAVRLVGTKHDLEKCKTLADRIQVFSCLAKARRDWIEAAAETTSIWIQRIKQILEPAAVAVPKIPCPECGQTHYKNDESFINRTLIATTETVQCHYCGALWTDVQGFAEKYIEHSESKVYAPLIEA